MGPGQKNKELYVMRHQHVESDAFMVKQIKIVVLYFYLKYIY